MKLALITGGAIRIGFAFATHLAERGYDIALHYNASEAPATEAAAEIRKKGVRCEIFRANLADATTHETLIPAVLDKMGSVSLLINSAGIYEKANIAHTHQDLYDRQMTINLKAPYFLTKSYVDHSKSGHIINVTDANIHTHDSGYVAYMLTKKALFEFTKLAAVELAPDYRVNAIAPGPILPPPGEDETYLQKVANQTPLKQTGHPTYLTQALDYLLDNPLVTGHNMYVDGGGHLIR